MSIDIILFFKFITLELEYFNWKMIVVFNSIQFQFYIKTKRYKLLLKNDLCYCSRYSSNSKCAGWTRHSSTNASGGVTGIEALRSFYHSSPTPSIPMMSDYTVSAAAGVVDVAAMGRIWQYAAHPFGSLFLSAFCRREGRQDHAWIQ